MDDLEEVGIRYCDLPFKHLVPAELRYNQQVFLSTARIFKEKFPAAFTAFEHTCPGGEVQPLISARVMAVLRAVTHDLLRYASYQIVPFNDALGRYEICPSVRAAYFTKWIMVLRPYCLDAVTGHNAEHGKWFAYYCNELSAMIAASVCLSSVGVEGGKKISLISDLLEIGELKTFMYHLRYRVKHQDSYSLFYRRIKEQYLLER